MPFLLSFKIIRFHTEQHLYVGILKHLSVNMAQNLFNSTNIPLGARVEFVFQWSKWMESQREQLPSDDNANEIPQTNEKPQSMLRSQKHASEKSKIPSISSNSTSTNLLEILKSNAYGKSVMKAFMGRDGKAIKNPQLTDKLRKSLIESILQYCIVKKLELTKSNCELLTKQICKEFPGELAVQHNFPFI